MKKVLNPFRSELISKGLKIILFIKSILTEYIYYVMEKNWKKFACLITKLT